MAQIYVGTEGSQVIPGATASWKAQAAKAGLATSGVLLIIGEADAGPDFTLESNLNSNAFGPGQESAVVAKYRSGPIVDAYKAACEPLNDDNVPGSPSRIIILKTNPSTKASAALLKHDATSYGTLFDKSYGKLGNNIYRTVEAQQNEAVPTTSSFTWITSVGTVDVAFRANGAARVVANLAANATPAAVVAAINALAGIAATGGAARTTIQASTGNLAVTLLSGNSIRIDYTGSFTTAPSIGDTVVIPTGSVIDAGAGDQNVGSYVVTAATVNSITCTKLSDAGKAGAVAGTVTAPQAVGSVAVSATVANDMVVYAPVSISLEAGDPSPGLGKSLEIAELTTGTDLLSRSAFALSSVAVTWVSKTGAAKLISSGSEYIAKMTVGRMSDSLSEEFIAGGDIGLKVSYMGTTAVMAITDTALTTTVVGGAGANLNLSLKDFPTISDLATYINTQTGYKAAPGTNSIGQLPATALDDGSFGIASEFGASNGRIKVDGYKFFKKVSETAILVQFGNPAAQAAAGLPAPATMTFLSGGAKGGTTAALYSSALSAAEKVRCNFVVPCFSRDATADILDGLTESSSTYTIDGIHAATRTHVNAMSKKNRRKARQAFLSIRSTFAEAKEKAGAMASFRCSMSFLDQKVESNGVVTQFQPWMDAALAAGGQAAGFYRAIVKKVKNVSGSLQAAGDWDAEDDIAVEDALLAGLLPTRMRQSGAYEFASDQTTYTKDPNFVYNSIQAVYISDTIALTTAQRMEDNFAGQSVADVGAPAALTFLESIMADFLRLKMIAPSVDAPLGFKNAQVEINGPAMVVDLEVKLAGAIYFIPISFLVSPVEQSASQG